MPPLRVRGWLGGWEAGKFSIFSWEVQEEEGLAGGKAASLGWRSALDGALGEGGGRRPGCTVVPRRDTNCNSLRKAQRRSESASVLHGGRGAQPLLGGTECLGSEPKQTVSSGGGTAEIQPEELSLCESPPDSMSAGKGKQGVLGHRAAVGGADVRGWTTFAPLMWAQEAAQQGGNIV